MKSNQPTPAPWTVVDVQREAMDLEIIARRISSESFARWTRMLDAYADLLAASAWRPIETAPRDGTEILTIEPNYCGGSTIKQVVWTSGTGIQGGGYWVERRFSKIVNPKHWMPMLPPPPDARAAKE